MHRAITTFFVLMAMAVMVGLACGGDSPPEASVSPTATLEATAILEPTVSPKAKVEHTPTPGPTATPTGTQTAAATSEQAPTKESLVIDEGTTLQELLDHSDASELECIDAALGESMERTMGFPAIDRDLSKLVPCLSPETGRDLILTDDLSDLARDGWHLSEEEVSCLREVTASTDPALVMAGDRIEGGKFITGTFSCFPNPLIYALVQAFGIKRGDLNQTELSCLTNNLSGIDFSLFAGMDQADPWEFNAHIIPCLPDQFIASFIEESFLPGSKELSSEQVSCLRKDLAELDWSSFDKDSANVAHLLSALFYCIPGPMASNMTRSMLSFHLGHFAGTWFNNDELSEMQITCLRERTDDIDWEAFINGDQLAAGEIAKSLFNCAPDILIKLLTPGDGLEKANLDEDELYCIRKQVGEFDWSRFIATVPDGGSNTLYELTTVLEACLPALQDGQEAVTAR